MQAKVKQLQHRCHHIHTTTQNNDEIKPHNTSQGESHHVTWSFFLLCFQGYEFVSWLLSPLFSLSTLPHFFYFYIWGVSCHFKSKNLALYSWIQVKWVLKTMVVPFCLIGPQSIDSTWNFGAILYYSTKGLFFICNINKIYYYY